MGAASEVGAAATLALEKEGGEELDCDQDAGLKHSDHDHDHDHDDECD